MDCRICQKSSKKDLCSDHYQEWKAYINIRRKYLSEQDINYMRERFIKNAVRKNTFAI